MTKELLFVYIEDLNGCFINQGINFSPDYHIEFNHAEGELVINKKINPTLTNFFGEHITSLNLIVGKNGSGKSSILELLGSTSRDRNDLFNGEVKPWFALYSDEYGRFMLEGYDLKIIKNLVKSDDFENKINEKYAVIVELVERELFVTSFITEEQRNSLCLYLDRVSNNQAWYSRPHLSSEDGSDNQLGYERNSIDIHLSEEIFKLIKQSREDYEMGFDAKNVQAIINRKSFRDDYSKEFLNDLNLYNDPKIMLYKKRGSGLFNKEVSKKQWSNQERFIIELLEESICYIHESISLNKFESKHIMENFYIEDQNSFDARIDYLLNVITIQNKNIGKSLASKIEITPDRLISALVQLKPEAFLNKNLIKLDLTEMERNAILFTFIDKTEGERDIFPIKIEYTNLSSGELHFINHISKITKSITKAHTFTSTKNIIFLLDEPERDFHPEWSRRYISNLVKLLNGPKNKTKIKFQVIITTHSPFLISDVPKECITTINVLKKDGEIIREIRNSEFGFASNYYDLIQNNFFVDSPVGEYAKEKISGLIKEIDAISIENSDYEDLKNNIGLIDDPLMKSKIMQYFNQKIKEVDVPNEIKLELRLKEVLKEKNDLENKIRIHKENGNDKLK